jgi:DNA transposition AAA+ family ATPase
MLIIIGTRGNGKTAQLLRYAAENEVIFISPYAKELTKKLNISNYENMEFISCRDFHNFNYDKSRFIVIDGL